MLASPSARVWVFVAHLFPVHMGHGTNVREQLGVIIDQGSPLGGQLALLDGIAPLEPRSLRLLGRGQQLLQLQLLLAVPLLQFCPTIPHQFVIHIFFCITAGKGTERTGAYLVETTCIGQRRVVPEGAFSECFENFETISQFADVIVSQIFR